MLRCEFKGKPGESQVIQGQYQIMTAHRKIRLIEPAQWEDSVFPGSKLVMAVVLDHLRLSGGICPKCGGSFESFGNNLDEGEDPCYERW